MTALIDASVLIAAERDLLDLGAKIESADNPDLRLSAITVSEMLHGVYRAQKPHHRSRRQEYVDHLLGQFPVLPFDIEVARIHAKLWADLSSKGINVGSHDLMIAATAMTVSAAVITRDQRSFPLMPKLHVLHW